ncbi:MAG: hypothetical protein ACLFT0_02830 [Spirulinaceae cyanobacterium]
MPPFFWPEQQELVESNRDRIRDLALTDSALSPDGKTMILGDNNGSIHRLDLNSELRLEDFKVCHSTPEVLNPNYFKIAPGLVKEINRQFET